MRAVSLISFFLFAIAFRTAAQNVTINGAAPAYKGKPVSIYTYDDLITYREVKQVTDTVDTAGKFELRMNANATQRVFLKIDNKKAHLYTSPGGAYDVEFPAPDTTEYHNPNVEELVNLNWRFKDTLDLNALIIHYNLFFEHFYTERYAYFATGKAFIVLDSFRLMTSERYKHVKNEYFRNYMDYYVGSLKASFSRNEKSVNKQYITNRAVQHNNQEYMDVFNYVFKKYFQKLSLTQRGQQLLSAINAQGSYPALEKTLAAEELLAKDTLRELVMLRGLMDAYNDPNFSRGNIQSILEYIESNSKISLHRKIAGNISRMHATLATGSKAPGFELPTVSGKTVSLSEFAGKHVYIMFFTTECTSCLQELKAITDLKKEFGDQVVFISISLDDSLSILKDFLVKNPKYNWHFLYAGNDTKLKEDYRIKGAPAFFLVNTFGKLAQHPAKSPGQGIEDTFRKITGKKEKKKPGEK
jgi:thiol-disulfide isomerase/thioredoxin